MILNLNHKNLEVYKLSEQLVLECYKLSNNFPPIERFTLVQQIRRAALSVKLNIAEGSSRKSEIERKRFFEISRGSLIEIDAAFEVSIALKYLDESQLQPLEKLLNSCFALLSKMIST